MRLVLPPHFDPSQVGEVWRVPYGEVAGAAREWARRYDIRPAVEDARRVALMLVDTQNTFCVPGFELFVAGRSGRGAIDDNIRVCEFLYRNLARITDIVATLDTHVATQIFHPVFLVDQSGEHPPPMTAVTVEDVERGRWRVNPALAGQFDGASLEWLQDHLRYYCRRLAETGKYTLMIWPYHAMLGGLGHALVSSVAEALFFHSVARQTPTRFEIKGNRPLTEHYSVLGPEVREAHDGTPLGERNAAFIERLLGCDAVIVAGQARSHCVAWTVEDLLAEIPPDLSRKVYLLEDCTSPVVVPGVVDFTDEANEHLRRFAARGMHVVRSTDPIDGWPDFPA
jgi:nicotinamidase-related amidase